jgi:hypothetical protein
VKKGELEREINVSDTLQLFLPIFPDSVVRAKAVSWLEQENSDQVLFFSLILVIFFLGGGFIRG